MSSNKAWKEANPDKVRIHQRRAHYKSEFGLTLEEADAILAKPCSICGGEAKHLDHSHRTGQVRSALCVRCNMALGGFMDSPALLRRAADYLEEHE